MERICKTCGRDFQRRARPGKGFFCSVACRQLGRRNRASVNCALCLRPFEVTSAQAARRVFCSSVCAKTAAAEARWESLIERTESCWNWLGTIQANGYGRFGRKAHHFDNALAHRIAYEKWVGPIPDGLTIDHLCRNRRCVNPSHLEPVTRGDNVRRALAGKTYAEIRAVTTISVRSA